MGFPWAPMVSYPSAPMGLPWIPLDFRGIPWVSRGSLMGRASHWCPMGRMWVPMGSPGLPRFSHRLFRTSMGRPRVVHGSLAMGYRWGCRGAPVGLPWGSHGMCQKQLEENSQSFTSPHLSMLDAHFLRGEEDQPTTSVDWFGGRTRVRARYVRIIRSDSRP